MGRMPSGCCSPKWKGHRPTGLHHLQLAECYNIFRSRSWSLWSIAIHASCLQGGPGASLLAGARDQLARLPWRSRGAVVRPLLGGRACISTLGRFGRPGRSASLHRCGPSEVSTSFSFDSWHFGNADIDKRLQVEIKGAYAQHPWALGPPPCSPAAPTQVQKVGRAS